MQNIIRLFVLSVIVLVLTSCGGSDSKGEVSTTPKNLSALEAIAKYEKVPTIEQYKNAGITGVTADNLDEINAIVESSAYRNIDTQGEIQVLVDGLSVKGEGKTPVIKLIGANPQFIKLGTPYVELNASTNDGSIRINSSAVDTNTLGKYNVTYTAINSNGKETHVSRTVNVIEVVIVDTKSPIITLNGANPLSLIVGDIYTEAGSSAKDDIDGNVSAEIVIDSSNVNTNIAGTYTVTYNVSDTKGNKAVEVKRTVIVKAVKENTNPAITRTKLISMIANGEDVTKVNTSEIKYMDFLFSLNNQITTDQQKENVLNFNQDISSWDVSKVSSMESMFMGTKDHPHKFNQDISSWDTSNVVKMRGMFYNSEFNQDISKWNISHIVDNVDFTSDISALIKENDPFKGVQKSYLD